jgi:hypothetical protein
MDTTVSSYANQSDVIIDSYGGRPSPTSCSILKGFTVYAILMFSTALVSNSLLLLAFIKEKTLRSPVNMFIIAVSVCNIIATLSEAQFIIPSTFACRYLFYHTETI